MPPSRRRSPSEHCGGGAEKIAQVDFADAYAGRSRVARLVSGILRRHAASVDSMADGARRCSQRASVTVAASPGCTVNAQVAPSPSARPTATARGRPRGSRHRARASHRTRAATLACRAMPAQSTTDAARRRHRPPRARVRTSSGPSLEVERVLDDQSRAARPPTRFRAPATAGGSGETPREHPPRRSQREATAAVVVEDREQQRRGVDPRPAEPRDVAVGVDERGGPRISEQRVLADRMLHAAQPSRRRLPADRCQGTASGGIVSAMLAIFSAQLGSLA